LIVDIVFFDVYLGRMRSDEKLVHSFGFIAGTGLLHHSALALRHSPSLQTPSAGFGWWKRCKSGTRTEDVGCR
jgi:hypothetical protein